MSDSSAQELLQEAIRDDSFRQKLRDNFDAAISGYDLTSEEIEALRSLDWSNPIPSDTKVLGTWVHIYKSSPMI